MESEEFEQIPWANLVAEHTAGIDKRIYLVVGLVGVIVVALLGMRLLGEGAQPPMASALPAPDAGQAAVSADVAPPTPMVVSEADLITEEPEPQGFSDRLVEASAEWFVTDWFTRDGSDETIRSIRDALSPSVESVMLPHETDDEPVTFVEWARATEMIERADGSVAVTVAYRAIREVDGGFVRDPVESIVVGILREGDAVTVVSLPTAAG